MAPLSAEERSSWRARKKQEWIEIEQVLADAERRYQDRGQHLPLVAAKELAGEDAARISTVVAPDSGRRYDRTFAYDDSISAHAPSRRHEDDIRRGQPVQSSLSQTPPRYLPLAWRSPVLGEYVRMSSLIRA